MKAFLVAGSEVQMADGSTKKIEEVVIGDQVLSNDLLANAHKVSTVESLDNASFLKNDIKVVTLSNGREIVMSTSTKLFIKDKGAVEVSNLVVGDVTIDVDGSENSVTSISEIDEAHGLFEDTACGLLSVGGSTDVENLYLETILIFN